MDPLVLIIIVLLILWATGSFAFQMGGIIHVLLVVIIIVVLIRLLQGRSI